MEKIDKCKCPYCGGIQTKNTVENKHSQEEDFKLDLMRQFFGFNFQTIITCKECNEQFIEEKNELMKENRDE